jgi:hypothetical protein
MTLGSDDPADGSDTGPLTFASPNSKKRRLHRQHLLQPPDDPPAVPAGDAPAGDAPAAGPTRVLTPSFTIMDENGCFATPQTPCVLTTATSAGVTNYYNACPTGRVNTS